jgi:large subunit ribosomal protein L23
VREPWDVIVRPVITEKTTAESGDGVYTFIVSTAANKHEIAHAIEKVFDVSVTDVRTMRYAGKLKRALLGRMVKNHSLGRRAGFKKAVVRLAEGNHIELYEFG